MQSLPSKLPFPALHFPQSDVWIVNPCRCACRSSYAYRVIRPSGNNRYVSNIVVRRSGSLFPISSIVLSLSQHLFDYFEIALVRCIVAMPLAETTETRLVSGLSLCLTPAPAARIRPRLLSHSYHLRPSVLRKFILELQPLGALH